MVRSVLHQLERFARTTAKRSELTWRYGTNLLPTLSYKLTGDRVSAEAARVLQDLDRDGVAITSTAALVGTQALEELFSATSRVRREHAAEIEAARVELESPTTTSQKPFVVPLLGVHPHVDAGSPFGRFALHPMVLQVVNGYYGMYARLRHYNIWHNLKTTRPATQSQLWHRDPEDRYILKLFVALEDIDDGCGPFTYAAGSHLKGNARQTPEYMHKDGTTTRSNDEQMGAVVPPERWITCRGPKGTMIFADTRGYHRGGLARERDRLLYIAEYTSLGGGRGGIPTRP